MAQKCSREKTLQILLVMKKFERSRVLACLCHKRGFWFCTSIFSSLSRIKTQGMAFPSGQRGKILPSTGAAPLELVLCTVSLELLLCITPVFQTLSFELSESMLVKEGPQGVNVAAGYLAKFLCCLHGVWVQVFQKVLRI